MKKIVTILLVCAACLPVAAQTGRPDSEKDGLNGRVRQVIEGDAEDYRTVTTYDPNGNVIQVESHYGDYHTRVTLQRNATGEITLRLVDLSGGKGGPVSLAAAPVRESDGAEVYRIAREARRLAPLGTNGDAQPAGESVEETGYAGDVRAWRGRYYYDSVGRLVAVHTVFANDLVMRSRVHSYESQVRSPHLTEYLTDGRVERREWYEYEFDDRGNWIKRTLVKEEPVLPAEQSRVGSVTTRTITYY